MLKNFFKKTGIFLESIKRMYSWYGDIWFSRYFSVLWIMSNVKKVKEEVQKNEHSIWMNNVDDSVVE